MQPSAGLSVEAKKIKESILAKMREGVAKKKNPLMWTRLRRIQTSAPIDHKLPILVIPMRQWRVEAEIK